MQTWYQSTIQTGDQTGRRFVYPTINLSPAVLPPATQRGVYASLVKLAETTYRGALYFGPRIVKNETHDVLEIYLLDFQDQVEAEQVEFTLSVFLRGVLDFPDLESLRLQVTKDIIDVRKVFNEK